jgi:hypothetical protein
MFRRLISPLTIALAGICLVGCNSHPDGDPKAQAPLEQPSQSPSTRPSSQVDLPAVPFELEADVDSGWVEQSKTNPAVWNLFSRYRGSLFEITAIVTDVQNPWRLQTRSITDRRDTVFFHIAPEDSLPGHRESRTARLAYDAYNSGLNFEKGEKYIIAFTPSGKMVAFWRANLTVVPGWWYPQWWGSPNDEPWNDHRPKQPPGFSLIPSKSNSP